MGNMGIAGGYYHNWLGLIKNDFTIYYLEMIGNLLRKGLITQTSR